MSVGTQMRIVNTVLCLCLSCLFCRHAFGQPPGGNAGASFPAGEVTEYPEIPLEKLWTEGYGVVERRKTYIKGPNVHRSPLYCDKCHVKGEKPTADNLLYGGDDLELCRTCHPKSVYDVHVVNIRPKRVKVPPGFPLPGGRVTCVTCHDEPSCNPKGSPSWKRPYFLRGTKTGFMFCFECHPER